MIVLDNIGDRSTFHTNEKFSIDLTWDVEILWLDDMDLMAFYLARDGSMGGVFSSEYGHRKKDYEGSLFEFPYIRFCNYSPITECENSERIYVQNMQWVDEINIVAVEYDLAVGDGSQYKPQESMHIFGDDSKSEKELEKIELSLYNNDFAICVPMTIEKSKITSNPVLLIARLTQKNEEIVCERINEYMTVENAYNNIPGFKQICY